MKLKFNLHTHTWRCGHAVGDDHEYIENAIAAGFQCIGFSEHIQYRADNGKYNRIDFEDFPQYFKDFEQLKRQYAGQIKILCGLEAAYVPEAIQDLMELKQYGDYIIMGHHQGGLRARKYGLSCDDDELDFYSQEIISGIQTGLYCIIAHPDFFMVSRDCWNDRCEKNAYRICEAAKKYHIPLELNIKGSYSATGVVNGKDCIKYPYREFWKIAAEVGNQVLFGWDAHAPSDLFRTTERIERIIEGLNLDILT